MEIFLSRLHFPITTLGPGRRVGLWFQGCSLHCPGCISVDTWAHGSGKIALEALFSTLRPWLADSDGVTLSGGEPLEQAEALHALLHQLRLELAPTQDILLYTGWRAEKAVALFQNWQVRPDAIVADPYQALAGQTKAWRGSDNQRLLAITELGQQHYDRYREALRSDLPKSLDLVFEENTLWMAGIPEPQSLALLQEALSQAGFQASLSSDSHRSFPPIFA